MCPSRYASPPTDERIDANQRLLGPQCKRRRACAAHSRTPDITAVGSRPTEIAFRSPAEKPCLNLALRAEGFLSLKTLIAAWAPKFATGERPILAHPGLQRATPVHAACGCLLLIGHRTTQCASGSGRSWKCTARGKLPLPPSINHGVRSPLVVHKPRPFQPLFGSSMRPSNPFA
jgi:hypothetical protein